MILLMSATANTILSFLVGMSFGSVIVAYWYKKENVQQDKELKDPAETKIIYISSDIESSLEQPNVPNWKKASN